MKQVRKVLPALAILAFLCIFCTLLTAAADVITVSTPAELESAVSTLAATGGTIRFSGDISLTSSLSLPQNSARITIDGGGYTLRMNGNLALNGDMDVKNICFYNIGTYRSIPCGGHDVHFYDTVTCGKSGDYYPSIMAGYTASAAFTGGRLTVDGGTWQRIRGGNAGTGSVLQSGSVVINGGSITEFLQICGAGASAPGSRFDVTVNGGSITNIRFFSVSGSAASTADSTLTVNGGKVGGTIRLSIFDSSTLRGESTIRLLGGDFSGLTGIYGYAGSGSLRTNLILSPSLTGVIENRITDTLSGTLLRTGVADPCLLYANGLYYLTMTGSSNIALLRSTSLDGLGSLTLSQNLVYRGAQDTTATDTFGYTELSGTWSPELHYFDVDDFGADYAGWYMFLALRKKGDDSSNIRMVALKSKYGETPEGPYRHPTDGTTYKSQPILDRSGNIITEWACGMSILRIESGAYKGIYAMWVAEENRGTAAFRQKIMIARLKSPWQLASEPTAILYPSQYWEKIDAGYWQGKYYPAVVEGATALYGKDGQVYVIYCGSGYWTNYGLGQITWNGGDPQSASSWVKYTDNPVFGANDKNGNHYSGVMMQGAGHAFFVRDAEDKLYAVYHAYPSDADGSNKASARNAYIEPCSIDYTKFNGANYGVLTFANGKKPANTSMKVSFTTRLSASSLLDLFDDSFDAAVTLDAAASLSAEPVDGGVLLRASYKADGIEGCEIRRKVDGGAFVKLTDLTGGDRAYTDTATEANTAYAYIALPYMEHGGTRYYGAPSDEATAEVRLDPPTLEAAVALDSGFVALTISHTDRNDRFRIYKYDAEQGAGSKTLLAEIEASQSSRYLDADVEMTHTYVYTATAILNGLESAPSAEQRIYIPIPRLTLSAKTIVGGGIRLTVSDRERRADSYKFERINGGSWPLLSDSASMTCTDTDVVPGTTYLYIVTAYENGEAVSSTTVYGAATALKPRLRITATESSLTINIPEVSGGESYNLYLGGALFRSGTPGASIEYDYAWDDGKYVFRLDVLDEDGRVFDSVTQTLRIGAHYDKAYDTNGDGVCDIRDALLSLQNVLNGKGGTLADILNLLRFLAD